MSNAIIIVFLCVLLVALMCLALYAAFTMYQFVYFNTAPFVPTKDDDIERMLKLAALKEGTHVVEIGSGNGEICIRAATHGAIVTGIEVNPFLVWWAAYRTRKRGMTARVKFLRINFWKYTLPKDTQVVFVYLLPDTLKLLYPKLRRELRAGTVVISNRFEFLGETPTARDGNILKYVL